MIAMMMIWGIRHPKMGGGVYCFPMQILARLTGFSFILHKLALSRQFFTFSSPGRRMSQKQSPGGVFFPTHCLKDPCPFTSLNSCDPVLLLTLIRPHWLLQPPAVKVLLSLHLPQENLPAPTGFHSFREMPDYPIKAESQPEVRVPTSPNNSGKKQTLKNSPRVSGVPDCSASKAECSLELCYSLGGR